MKNTLFPFVLVLFIIGNSACFNSVNKKEILGTWKVVEIVDVNSEVTEMNEMMESMARTMFITEGYTLNVFDDHKYSDISGILYGSGEWTLKNGRVLNFGANSMVIDNMKFKKGEKHFIGTYEMNEGDTQLRLKFRRIWKPLKKFKKDPLHPSNNKWRIKPDKPESDVELYDRLLNYVQHFALLFYAGYNRDIQRVNWAHSSGVIKVYGNGIGTIDFQQINQSWIDCFYSESEAEKAFQFYQSIFNKLDYKGGNSKNRFLNKYNMLMAIHDQLQLEQLKLY